MEFAGRGVAVLGGDGGVLVAKGKVFSSKVTCLEM